ncbi:hypothetical protein FisN_23Lh199 [Fistulifera solaris]|uniref:Uncharacterized protein n=1 Tax=Fistulifera solaris TaxID=1519565 RepID=A0A1Z5JRT5_FISSO|nr:hypothetical protein FisN_23Lh199 [Fistulifera solaris]|eukprot:GAX16669.1 hypothetical protein FisN_23Lh199 [Fistulifera solaris]
MIQDSFHFVYAGIATMFLAVVAIVAFLFRNSSKTSRQQSSPPFSGKVKPKQSVPSNLDTSIAHKHNNPWQERLERGVISTAVKRTQNDASSSKEKPFQSSYYYAHNNPSAKGGYKDGLRMEDYTMNQPRLLRRNGSRVSSSEDLQQNETAPSSIESSSSKQQLNNPRVLPKLPPTKYISRYLWDDPGKPNGVASIRIEQLPDKNGSMMAWKDWLEQQYSTTTTTNKPQIDTLLSSDCTSLRVIIHSQNGCLYELKLDPLYGRVKTVTTKVSTKRLTIQLHKNENKQTAWPHPYQSKTKSN